MVFFVEPPMPSPVDQILTGDDVVGINATHTHMRVHRIYREFEHRQWRKAVRRSPNAMSDEGRVLQMIRDSFVPNQISSDTFLFLSLFVVEEKVLTAIRRGSTWMEQSAST